MMLRASSSLALLSLFTFSGCELFSVSAPTSTPMEKDYGRSLADGEVALELVTDRSQYPDFGLGFGRKDDLLLAVDRTLEYFAKPSSKRWWPYKDHEGKFSIDHERALASLHAFRKVLTESSSGAELNQKIADNFDVFRSKGWNRQGEVLFTGYCQPIYDASPTQSGEYRYPLYRLPPELKKEEFTGTPLGWEQGGSLGSSPKRAEFDGGYLNGRGLELYWLKSRLETYIVQVQGSARLRMQDGSMRAVGYAGKTEHEYKGLGSTLVEEGKVSKNKLSLRAIKDYFAQHPDQVDPYTQKNESYVFFTDITGGPYGSLNIEVTPYRTLATDKAVFPRGGVCFTQTKVPMRGGINETFNQFMLDQDTGGAIRSAGRGDIFIGTGDEAEEIAGGTYAEGKLWYIYLKPGANP
jgi:membrane-bound lytic murein transglycosylase A